MGNQAYRREETTMKRIALAVVCLAIVVPAISRADTAANYQQLYEEQKKRNDELEKRLAILEEKDAAAPYLKTEDFPEATLGFLQQTEISGFVSASYTYNFNRPADQMNGGRLYDSQHNEFMLNKLTLILQKPVEYNAFDWQAGYFVEGIFGQDAQSTRAKSPDTSDGLFNLGDNGDIEQAYLQFNIPIGNGLKVVLGKYATPIGWELVENEQNANWSCGYQWTFIEPFTHTGLQLGYKINDEWEANLYINQGWDTVKDNNNSKSFIGRLAYAPNDAWSFTLIGFGGPEQSDNDNDPANAVPGANGLWRKGVNFVAWHQCSPKVATAFQADYGEEEGGDANGGAASWYAFGLFTTYEVNEKVQIACRGDFLSDKEGNRTSDFLFPTNGGQDVWSLTMTVNFKPVEGLRLAPEIRYDRSSFDSAFDGHDDQFTAAMGAVYSF